MAGHDLRNRGILYLPHSLLRKVPKLQSGGKLRGREAAKKEGSRENKKWSVTMIVPPLVSHPNWNQNPSSRWWFRKNGSNPVKMNGTTPRPKNTQDSSSSQAPQPTGPILAYIESQWWTWRNGSRTDIITAHHSRTNAFTKTTAIQKTVSYFIWNSSTTCLLHIVGVRKYRALKETRGKIRIFSYLSKNVVFIYRFFLFFYSPSFSLFFLLFSIIV